MGAKRGDSLYGLSTLSFLLFGFGRRGLSVLLLAPVLGVDDPGGGELLELGDDVCDGVLAVDLVVAGADVHGVVGALLLANNWKEMKRNKLLNGLLLVHN